MKPNIEAQNFAKKLADEGMTYEAIAKQLRIAGIKTPKGTSYSKGGAHGLVMRAGGRSSTAPINPEQTQRRKKRRRMSIPTQADNTKWELLSAVERCTALSPSSRKALLEIIFKELNK